MYRLDVFHPGSTTPTESVAIERAADALARIADLLARHGDCERVAVLHGGQILFSVDCKGATIGS